MQSGTILDEIVAQRRIRIGELRTATPVESLREGITGSDRDFAAALRQPRPAYILECKRASPSKGLIRPDLNLDAIAAVYGRYASAISVLTEPDWFQGSFDHLSYIRTRVSQPVLCKDFVFDPWQVLAARRAGADAILLILAMLDDNEWKQLAELAASLAMTVLTEVSSEAEARRAIQLGAPVVGINNRDLRDMSIDTGRTSRLSLLFPPETLVISESGYFSNCQTRGMSRDAHGFLVGTSLMAEENLTVAVKRLIFGDHKVCGLTRNDMAVAADRAGAVYGGAVFADRSPRRVTAEQAAEIFAGTDLRRVGVFHNHSQKEVLAACERANLDVVQLHGGETTEFFQELKSQAPRPLNYWKALSSTRAAAEGAEWLAAGVDRILVDSHADDGSGGTGRTFDWSKLPTGNRDRMMLAGGLGIDNVRAALGPGMAGLDFNSSLEVSPGVKSVARIEQLFAEIRNY